MRLVLLVCALAAGSCGLIDESIDDFPLGFPRKPFTVDTSTWNLSVTGETFPAIPCGGDGDCAAAASQICSDGECTATCVSSNCQAHVAVGLFEAFNLAVDAPEYQTIDEQTAISVSVDTVEFQVDSNTMNVTVPPLRVYMAPLGVTDPGSAEAKLVGVVPAVAPGQVGTIVMEVDAAGRANLEVFMANFRTPFNVIVAANVDISAGDPVPEGMLQGWVKVAAHADAI